MTTFIQDAVRGYNDFISNDKYADPRTAKLFLVSNPLSIVILLSSYLYFCTKCGPRWMEKRKPFELTRTLVIYNLAQVLLSSYLAYEGTAMWWNFNFWCQPQDYSNSPAAIKMMELTWWYFLAKFTELLDTVLFVLRKKNKQISFLHLFHHTVMPLITWLGVRYLGGGHSTFFGVINSYVHIAMYSYYLIAALGPEYRKYLWWKRHLTEMQLIQFVVMFTHNLIPLFTSCAAHKSVNILQLIIQFVMVFTHNLIPLFTSCAAHKSVNMLQLILTGSFTYMFGNFYIKTYILANKKKE